VEFPVGVGFDFGFLDGCTTSYRTSPLGESSSRHGASSLGARKTRDLGVDNLPVRFRVGFDLEILDGYRASLGDLGIGKLVIDNLTVLLEFGSILSFLMDLEPRMRRLLLLVESTTCSSSESRPSTESSSGIVRTVFAGSMSLPGAFHLSSPSLSSSPPRPLARLSSALPCLIRLVPENRGTSRRGKRRLLMFVARRGPKTL